MERLKREEREPLAILETDLIAIVWQTSIPKSDEVSKEEPKEKKEVWDLLGHPSKKFNFKVKYTAPPSAALKEKNIIPSGWGDEFTKEDEVITIPLSNTPCVMGINIWYDSDEELSVNHVIRSGRVYQLAEKDMVKGKEVAKEVATKES